MLQRLKALKTVNWFDVFKSPPMLLVSLGLGLAFGALLPGSIEPLSAIGNAYLSALQLCALPIMTTGIIAGIYRLVKSHHSKEFVVRLVGLVMVGFAICNSVAIAIGWVMQSGRFDASTLEALGTEVNKFGIDAEIYRTLPPPPPELRLGLNTLADSLISDNIFAALVDNQTLAVLVFAIVLGAALGLAPTTKVSDRLVSSCDLIFNVFCGIADFAVACLPLGLIGLFAEQFAATGGGILRLMLGFVLMADASLLVLYFLAAAIVWWQARRPGLKRMVASAKDSTILALSTSSSLATLPYALRMMRRLRFNAEEVNSLLPIDIITFRYGTSFYFAFATIFVMTLYREPFGINEFVTISLGCVLASLASIGAAGIAALGCIEIVTSPLGLPVGAVLLIFVAIDPLVNPFRALVNIYAATAVTALVAENSRSPRDRPPDRPPD
ncbi:MAG: dicarboxylate/amino acid:cation symporter [Geitlerinemataceae cyanobacterium]